MKPLRLLAIVEAATVTGPAKNLLQFAQIARPMGVDVTIATFHRAGDSEVFQEAARRAGVPVELLEERGRFDRSVIASLRQLRRRLAPDLVQTHAVKSHLLARLAGLTPWVAFHHGYTWPDLRAQIYNQADRWSLRKASRVLTVSQPFAGELTRMGVPGQRICVIHNAIDPEWAQGSAVKAQAAQLRAELPIAAGEKVALIVGRLSREKDHLTLLEALAGIPFPPHLLIVGEGPERGAIEERLRATGQTRRVTLVGQVPTAEPYYAMADIAVLSSLSEGSPNALLEAMAAGVPVVATRVGGVPEIVAHEESALLVQPGERRQMASAITRLLTEQGLPARLTRCAKEAIRQRHSPAGRASQLCQVYRSLAEKEVD